MPIRVIYLIPQVILNYQCVSKLFNSGISDIKGNYSEQIILSEVIYQYHFHRFNLLYH